MKKIIIFAMIGLVFVSGCVGDNLKGDVSVDNDSIIFTPEPITVKIQDVVDIGINYVKGLFDFSEEEIVNESVTEQTDD